MKSIVLLIIMLGFVVYFLYPVSPEKPKEFICTYAVQVKDNQTGEVLPNSKVTSVYNQKHCSGYADAKGVYRVKIVHLHELCPDIKLRVKKYGYEFYAGFVAHDIDINQIQQIKLTRKVSKVTRSSKQDNTKSTREQIKAENEDSHTDVEVIPLDEPKKDIPQTSPTIHSNQTHGISNNTDNQQQNYEPNYPPAAQLENQTIANSVHAQFDCGQVSEISQAECEALVNLYIETDGENWVHKKNWLQTYEPCSWHGILACENNSVTEISLQYNQLKGKIPDFSALSSLKRLVLHGNQLTGTIPTFKNLTELAILGLSENQLTGEIPKFKTLTQLWVLSLSDNQLEGNIPIFAEHKILFGLGLKNNKLTGSIPRLDFLNNLTVLEMGGNNLCRHPDIDYSLWDEKPRTGIQTYPFCQLD